jgi:hypothetical protein
MRVILPMPLLPCTNQMFCVCVCVCVRVCVWHFLMNTNTTKIQHVNPSQLHRSDRVFLLSVGIASKHFQLSKCSSIPMKWIWLPNWSACNREVGFQ